MRKCKTGRPQAYDQHLVPGGRLRIGSLNVQRIPAREQAVDLEAPRQFQNILERTRLNLWNVDRILLLEYAALHAVITDPMTCPGAHRVVDGHRCQRTDRI